MVEDLIIENICDRLRSSERRERQKALKELLEYCENGDKTSNEVADIYDKCYLHILNCYYDKYENCRELACEVVNAFMKKLPQNDYYLKYIISAIARRIGKREIIEESEEMRLLILTQLNSLISKYTLYEDIDPLHDCYNDIIDILLKCLKDPFPAVLRESCSCINNLSNATKAFHYRVEALADPLTAIMHHKHSANRIAAINALGTVTLHITTNTECIGKILQEISPLLMDPVPQVRLECGKVGCRLLLELKDRYSFFDRILPLVLCSLKDDSPDIVNTIEETWIKCGELYFEENEAELNKKSISDAPPDNYPKNVKRPTLGCRSIVGRSFRTVSAILREVTDWKDDVRLHSLKLLYQFILHAEDAISTKFMEIYTELSKVCADMEPPVAKEALKVSDLLGRVLPVNEWLNHTLEALEKKAKLGSLKCFYALYSASNNFNKDDIETIAKIISDREYSHSYQAEFQLYLLMLVDVLWDRYTYNMDSVELAMQSLDLDKTNKTEEYIYHVIIKVMALSLNDVESNIHQLINSILIKIAEQTETSINNLHSKHLKSVLATFDILDVELDENNEVILLMAGIIKICGFQPAYFPEMKKAILDIWKNSDSEAIIKIFSAISIAMLSWGLSMSADSQSSEDLLQEFVKDVVKPHLRWQPGHSAEALRSIATAVLSSIAQGAPMEAPKIFPKLAKHFTSLIEDHNVSTRIYAMRCFMNFGKIKYEEMNKVGYAVMQRLDDPSSEVRIWSARALCRLNICEEDGDFVNDWHNFIKRVLAMLLLHLDGPDIKLKDVIIESLVSLNKQYPELFENSYKEALEKFGSGSEIHSLKKYIVNVNEIKKQV